MARREDVEATAARSARRRTPGTSGADTRGAAARRGGAGAAGGGGRSLRSDTGAAAVEFALIAGLFFLLVFGMIDFGFALHSWHITATGSREGARKAAVSSNVAQIEQRVRSATGSLDQARVDVTITCSIGGASFAPCSPPGQWSEDDLVRVAVEYEYRFITPFVSFVGLGPTVSVRSESEARFEGE